jgi:hypothetical protein
LKTRTQSFSLHLTLLARAASHGTSSDNCRQDFDSDWVQLCFCSLHARGYRTVVHWSSNSLSKHRPNAHPTAEPRWSRHDNDACRNDNGSGHLLPAERPCNRKATVRTSSLAAALEFLTPDWSSQLLSGRSPVCSPFTSPLQPHKTLRIARTIGTMGTIDVAPSLMGYNWVRRRRL